MSISLQSCGLLSICIDEQIHFCMIFVFIICIETYCYHKKVSQNNQFNVQKKHLLPVQNLHEHIVLINIKLVVFNVVTSIVLLRKTAN